jgi:hypothetical protein
MTQPPRLDSMAKASPPTPRTALLINPFYPKDPVASFGKHVLTPSLALTSIAGSTPPSWQVRYWDENLLQGPPPFRPFPALVGITVHLTFATRAYELARWYRDRGAQVVLGGLHVLSCPDEAAQHADSIRARRGRADLAADPARRRGGDLAAEVRGKLAHGRIGTIPRLAATYLPRRSFLTTTSLIATRGCHNRCGFCYLATEGMDMPYPRARRGAGGL